jgi:hypothetical protein
LDLTGEEKGMAGQIVPEFFNRAGERVEIPPEFVGVLKAAVRGAACVGCNHQHYLTAPKAAVTLPIVLPDRKHSLANGTASAGAEAECPAASPGFPQKN